MSRSRFPTAPSKSVQLFWENARDERNLVKVVAVGVDRVGVVLFLAILYFFLIFLLVMRGWIAVRVEDNLNIAALRSAAGLAATRRGIFMLKNRA